MIEMNEVNYETKDDSQNNTTHLQTDLVTGDIQPPLTIKVGPYFDGDQMILDTYQKARKPSKELLETVKLRPTYVSFPTPRSGRSPLGPYFNTPRVAYSSIDHSPPLYQTTPDSINEYFGSIKKLSVFGASLTGINYFIGVGILGLPFTLKITGWYGIASMIIYGIIMCYCGVLLGRCQFRLSLATYPDIAEAAYGYTGRDIVSLIFYFHLLFDMALFLTLMTNSMNLILLSNDIHLSSTFTTIFITVVLIFISSLWTNMNTICCFSVIGTISTILVFIVVIIICWQQYHDHSTLPLNQPIHSISSIVQESAIVILNQGKVFGIYSFCYMGHGVLPSLFNNMKNPSQYPIVITVVFVFITISYIIIASVGYLAYGMNVQGNIIDSFPLKSNFTILAASLSLTTVITKFVLACFPVSEGIIDMIKINQNSSEEEQYLQQSYLLPTNRVSRSNSLNTTHRVEYNIGYGSISESNQAATITTAITNINPILQSDEKINIRNKYLAITIRLLIPLVAMILMILLPNFVQLLSIIGAVFGSLICIIIPCLSYMKIYSDRLVSSDRMLLTFIICVGVISGMISILCTNSYH